MQPSERSRWAALERLGLWEAFLQRDAMNASESGGDFGLRWDPGVDLLKVPDAPGVCVLFYKNNRSQVCDVGNLFRHIYQCYRSPGFSLLGFSWICIEDPFERNVLCSRLQRLSYEGLWDYEFDVAEG